MFAHRLPVPTPFPVGPVNAYLLGPEPLTLVDCGPRTDEAWAALRAGIAAAGFRVEAVERLVLTHPHHDHAGLARRVREASGCAVLAHPLDHARLLDRPGEWDGIAGFLVEVCRRAGAPAAVLREIRQGLDLLPGYTEPLDEVAPLGEGDRLAVGPSTWTALHTPGHARGALCLWEPSRRLLLSGDTLLPKISSNAILEPDPGAFRERTLLVYRDTLGRLSDLGAASVLPGHGAPGGRPVPLIRRRLALQEARAERILALVAEGFSRPWQVAERLFPGLGATQAFLAVSEVVGHLDLLSQGGRMVFSGQEGPWAALVR